MNELPRQPELASQLDYLKKLGLRGFDNEELLMFLQTDRSRDNGVRNRGKYEVVPLGDRDLISRFDIQNRVMEPMLDGDIVISPYRLGRYGFCDVFIGILIAVDGSRAVRLFIKASPTELSADEIERMMADVASLEKGTGTRASARKNLILDEKKQQSLADNRRQIENEVKVREKLIRMKRYSPEYAIPYAYFDRFGTEIMLIMPDLNFCGYEELDPFISMTKVHRFKLSDSPKLLHSLLRGIFVFHSDQLFARYDIADVIQKGKGIWIDPTGELNFKCTFIDFGMAVDPSNKTYNQAEKIHKYFFGGGDTALIHYFEPLLFFYDDKAKLEFGIIFENDGNPLREHKILLRRILMNIYRGNGLQSDEAYEFLRIPTVE